VENGDKSDYLLFLNNLGEIVRRQGRIREALKILEDTMVQSKALLGNENPLTRAVRSNRVRAYEDAGRPNDSMALVLEGVLLVEFPDVAHALAGGTFEAVNGKSNIRVPEGRLGLDESPETSTRV